MKESESGERFRTELQILTEIIISSDMLLL